MEESLSPNLILENFTVALFFTAIVLLFSWIAWLQNFYKLPYAHVKTPLVTLHQLVTTFLILTTVYFFLPVVIGLILLWFNISIVNPLVSSYIQLMLYAALVLALYLYNIFQDHKEMKRIWKDWSFPGAESYLLDIKRALLTWLIALPTALAINYLVEAITLFFSEPNEQEQLAVEYLKTALSSRLSSTIAIAFILIVAPIIEEYIFRGVLQSWLRRYLTPPFAIISSAFIFAFFHYAPTQGMTNIPLIVSLFFLACYLGFLYEKTRSLIAPITLHVTFNLINVICIVVSQG